LFFFAGPIPLFVFTPKVGLWVSKAVFKGRKSSPP